MIQKLTVQIAAAYLGCQIVNSEIEPDLSNWEDSHLYGVMTDGTLTILSEEGFVTGNVSEGWQLALTRLEDITDEHAIFIYETIIGGPLGGDRYVVTRKKSEIDIESIYNEDHDDKTNVFIPYSIEIYYTQDGKINEVDGERMKIIIDYLRSAGYDCGHGSIPSLITAGIAVDAKTVNQ